MSTDYMPHTFPICNRDKEMAQGFLRQLDPHATEFTFQFIYERGKLSDPAGYDTEKKALGKKAAFMQHASLDAAWPNIERSNDRGYSVYVTVNETDLKGRRDKNIKRVRALFVDADNNDQSSRCVQILKSTTAKPTMAVKSSGGKLHLYWRVDDVPLEEFTPIQRALIEKFGTDAAVTDLPRVMRLPGTLHLKDEHNPQLVQLTRGIGQTWTKVGLVEALGLNGSAARATSRSKTSNHGTVAGSPFETPATQEQTDTINKRYAGIVPDALAAGIEAGWFDALDYNGKCRFVLELVKHLAAHTKAFVDYDKWVIAGLALIRSGLSEEHARKLFIVGSELVEPHAPREEIERKFDNDILPHAADGDRTVGIGTLIRWAMDAGFDTGKWKFAKAASAAAALNLPVVKKTRAPIRYGLFETEDAAIAMLNEHYLISSGDADRGKIFVIGNDQALIHIPRDDFATATAKICIKKKDKDGNVKLIPVAGVWIKHPQGNAKSIVFRPGAPYVADDEYNLWRGFAVDRDSGRAKVRRLMRHILRYICRGDKANFKHLMRWCAWIVQHPGTHTEKAVVLRGEMEGSGKSTIAKAMRVILGPHAFSLSKKEHLVGDFNEHLERVVFVQAEEAVWSGDLAAADNLKDKITNDKTTIHPKHRKARQVTNYLNFMFCTNHTHAVALGIRDRRYFVLDVDESMVGKEDYWQALYTDLDGGGYGQFLDLLLRVNLKSWHPRQMPMTAAAANQVRMSGNSFVQWMQTSLEIGYIASSDRREGHADVKLHFGVATATSQLLDSYTTYCRANQLRPLGPKQFSQELKKLFGDRKTLSSGSKGYAIPTEAVLQKKIDEELLGIKQ